MKKPKDDRAQSTAFYGDNEAQRRFRSALLGAKLAAAKPLKSITPKGVAAQRKKPKKTSSA